MTEPTAQAATPPAPADRNLRDRIAVVLAEADGWEHAKGLGLRDMSSDTQQHYDQLADAVLAVVPAPADQAAEIRAAAFKAAALFVRGHSADERFGKASVSTALCAMSDALLRLADETQPGTTPADSTRAVLAEIKAERRRQDEKWGEQNHPDIDPRDIPYVSHGYYASRADIWRQVNEERATPSKSVGRCTGHPEGMHTHTAWDGVLLEEAYEALAEEDPARLRAELVQVAAVAAAWIEAIDRRGAAPAEGSDH